MRFDEKTCEGPGEGPDGQIEYWFWRSYILLLRGLKCWR
jgi:hypothetical protein